MHPAMADCTLHMSLIPNNANTQPLQVKIPVSLGALVVPGRQTGLLRASWAAAESMPMANTADLLGNMSLTGVAGAAGASPGHLQFYSLQSKAPSSGRFMQASTAAAASMVCGTFPLCSLPV